MPFNRLMNLSTTGQSGRKFAEFLGIDEDEELELTEMQSKLFDKLYRLGAIRHTDGTRAHRRRLREREAEKRRRVRARAARQARRATRNRHQTTRNRRRQRAAR